MAVKKHRQMNQQIPERPEVFSWALCQGTLASWLGGMLAAATLIYAFNQQELLLGLLFAALLILVAVLDCRYLLIYDRLLVYLLLLGVLPLLCGRITWQDACEGAVLGGSLLLGLRTVSDRGMGWGDIKLAMVLGWWLGTTGICITLYMAFMSGGVYGLYLLLRQKFDRSMMVPFGPFLALGAIVSFALTVHAREFVEAWLWW